MSISDAFLPPDFTKAAAIATATSAQCSIYQRLRKSHGNRAGSLAWLLVRLGQPTHREHNDAVEQIYQQPGPSLAALASVVNAAREAAKTAAARELCDAISAVILNGQSLALMRDRPASK